MSSLPCVCTTRLSLSTLLAALLVSSMKVCILEQISRGAMLTSEVTQAPRSIRPIGSEKKGITKHKRLLLITYPLLSHFLGISRKTRCYLRAPPTSCARLQTRTRHQTWSRSPCWTPTIKEPKFFFSIIKISNLALAVTVQLEVDISIQWGNIGNSFQSPLLL